MITGSVLDILIYVFDRYMMNEPPDVPERENLARDLERVGFAADNVERALDWLTDLAFGHSQVPGAGTQSGVRVFTDSELARLSTECRGLLTQGPHRCRPAAAGLVIERTPGLDSDGSNTETPRWVVLMVLEPADRSSRWSSWADSSPTCAPVRHIERAAYSGVA
jgi:Smg protein